MKLPHLDHARIDPDKLAGYVLNPTHPEGRHKARVFRAALGLGSGNAHWLAKAILSAIDDAEAILQAVTEWGTIYRVEVEITRGRRCARIRSVWLCANGKARLVTCFVIGECN
jgi:hypothetical protein